MPSCPPAHIRPPNFAEPPRREGDSEPGQLRAWPGPARRRWQVGPARTAFVSSRIQPPPGRTSEPRGKPRPPPHGASGHCVKPRPPPHGATSNGMKPPPPRHRQIRPFRRVNCAQGRPRFHLAPPSHHARVVAVSRALRRAHRPPNPHACHRPDQHVRTGISAPPAPRPHQPGATQPTGATRPAANKPTHWHPQPTYRAR